MFYGPKPEILKNGLGNRKSKQSSSISHPYNPLFFSSSVQFANYTSWNIFLNASLLTSPSVYLCLSFTFVFHILYLFLLVAELSLAELYLHTGK